MTRARRFYGEYAQTQRKPARKTRTRRYKKDAYELGMETWHTAWLAGKADNQRKFRKWIREHGSERIYRLFSGPSDSTESKAFRKGVKEAKESMGFLGGEWRAGRLQNPRRRRKNFWGAPARYEVTAYPVRGSGRKHKKKTFGSKREAEAYAEHYAAMGHPRVDIEDLKTGDLISMDMHPRRAVANPRRRRNVSAALLREAREAGVPESVARRIAKRKPKSWEDAPMSVRQMKRTESGTKYWDVTTGYNTKYRYYLKKLSDGWVAEFRKMGKKGGAAPLRYINHQGTAKSHHTYFRTQGEAFRALVQHIMGGKHLPYRNPRRRR